LEEDYFLHSNKRIFIFKHAVHYSSSATRWRKRNTMSTFNNKFILRVLWRLNCPAPKWDEGKWNKQKCDNAEINCI